MENEAQLPSFLEESLKRIETLERERKTTFHKNLPSFIWTGVKSIIEICIVLALFDSLYGSELLMMGGIVILYVLVRSIGLKTVSANQAQSLALANEIYQIKKKLEIQQDDEMFEKLLEGNRQYNKLDTNIIIQSIGLIIIFTTALVVIFNNLS